MSPVDRACQVTAISATKRDHMKRLHVQLPSVSQGMSILRQRKRISGFQEILGGNHCCHTNVT